MGKKDKKDKKDKVTKKAEKDKKKKLSKEDKKKLKQEKKTKKVANKSAVANYARAPDAALVTKIKASETAVKTGAASPAKTAAEEWAAAGKAPGIQIWSKFYL
jgi:outer membrane biosynthesis protein TonB